MHRFTEVGGWVNFFAGGGGCMSGFLKEVGGGVWAQDKVLTPPGGVTRWICGWVMGGISSLPPFGSFLGAVNSVLAFPENCCEKGNLRAVDPARRSVQVPRCRRHLQVSEQKPERNWTMIQTSRHQSPRWLLPWRPVGLLRLFMVLFPPFNPF